MLSIEIIEKELAELASIQTAISDICNTTNNVSEKKTMSILHNQITHHIDKLKNYVFPLIMIINAYGNKMITDTLGRTLFIFVEEHGRNVLKHFGKELTDFVMTLNQHSSNKSHNELYEGLTNIYLTILAFINKCSIACGYI